MFFQSNEAFLLFFPFEIAETVLHTSKHVDLSSTFLPSPRQCVGGNGCSFNRFSTNSVFLNPYFITTP